MLKALVKFIFILSFTLTMSLSHADGGLIFLEKNQERNTEARGNDG